MSVDCFLWSASNSTMGVFEISVSVVVFGGVEVGFVMGWSRSPNIILEA